MHGQAERFISKRAADRARTSRLFLVYSRSFAGALNTESNAGQSSLAASNVVCCSVSGGTDGDVLHHDAGEFAAGGSGASGVRSNGLDGARYSQQRAFKARNPPWLVPLGAATWHVGIHPHHQWVWWVDISRFLVGSAA